MPRQPRTEDEIVGKLPAKVRLGDRDFDIRPLGIMKARAWRMKLTETMSEVIRNFQPIQGAEVTEAIEHGLLAGLIQFPEKIIDMVFAFAPELEPERERLMDEATEEQFSAAFSAIMQMAFPFLAQLGLITKVLATTSTSQASANSTR